MEINKFEKLKRAKNRRKFELIITTLYLILKRIESH